MRCSYHESCLASTLDGVGCSDTWSDRQCRAPGVGVDTLLCTEPQFAQVTGVWALPRVATGTTDDFLAISFASGTRVLVASHDVEGLFSQEEGANTPAGDDNNGMVSFTCKAVITLC